VTVLLDAFALIALFAEEPAVDEVEAILRRGEAAITTINLAEALDVLQRVRGVSQERAEGLVRPLLQKSVTVADVDETMACDAAGIRARHYHRTRAPISLADCVLIAAARSHEALATADKPVIEVAQAEDVKVKILRRRS